MSVSSIGTSNYAAQITAAQKALTAAQKQLATDTAARASDTVLQLDAQAVSLDTSSLAQLEAEQTQAALQSSSQGQNQPASGKVDTYL